MKKRFIAIFCVAALAVLLALPAGAASMGDAFDSIPFTGFEDTPFAGSMPYDDGSSAAMSSSGDVDPEADADGSVFAAGYNVARYGRTDGLLLAAGYNVAAAGASQHLMAAGFSVISAGDVDRDAFLAGYQINVSGDVGRDAYIAGNVVTVDGSVGRNLMAAGSNVTITGQVRGDVYLDAETIVISDGAKIGGSLRYNSTAQISVAAGADVGSTELYEATPAPEPQPEPGVNWSGKIFLFLGLVAAAFVLLWLTGLWEKLDAKYTGAPFGKYASAFGIGCAVLFAVPLGFVILMLTRVGLQIGFVILLLYIAALIVSPIFLGFFLGQLVWRKLFHRSRCYWAELPIGIAIYCLLALVPVLKIFVVFIGVALGLGTVTLLLGKKRKKPAGLQTPPAPLPSSDSPDAL